MMAIAVPNFIRTRAQAQKIACRKSIRRKKKWNQLQIF